MSNYDPPKLNSPEIKTPEIGFKIRPLKELWFEESLPASLYQYFTGNTKQRQAEKAREELKTLDPKSKEFKEQMRIYNKYSYLLDDGGSFDAVEAAKFIAAHPSLLGSELVNAILADPYLFAIPIWGWAKLGNNAVKALGVTSKASIRATKAAAMFGAGAAAGVALGVPYQLGEKGQVSASRTLAEASIAGTANLALGSLFGGLSTKVAQEANVSPSKMHNAISKAQKKYPNDSKATDKEIKKALDKILKEADDGRNPSITDDTIETIKYRYDIEKSILDDAVLLNKFDWRVAASLGGIGAAAGFITAEEDKLASAAITGASVGGLTLATKGVIKHFRYQVPKDVRKAKLIREISIDEWSKSMVAGQRGIQNAVRQFISNGQRLVKDPLKREAMMHALENPGAIKNGKFTFKKYDDGIVLEINKIQQAYVSKYGYQFFKNKDLSKQFRNEIAPLIDQMKNVTVKFNKTELNLIHDILPGFHNQMSRLMKASDARIGAVRNYISHEIIRGPGEDTFSNARIILQGPSKELDLWGMTGGIGKYGKNRLIPTLEEAMERGFRLRTDDLGNLDVFATMGRYGHGVGQALVEQRLIKALKQQNLPGLGTPAVHTNLSNIPKELTDQFIPYNHPNLNKQKWKLTPLRDPKTGKVVKEKYTQVGEELAYVHKDVAPYLRMIMDADDPNSFIKHTQNLNFFMKRFAVGASFFHAASLVESVLFTHGPWKGLKPAGQFSKEAITGKRSQMIEWLENPDSPSFKKFMVDEYKSTASRIKNSEYGDVFELLTKNGLIINTPEDVGYDIFYATFRKIEETVSKIPHVGKVMNDLGVRPLRSMFRWFDKVTWERAFTSMKLYTGMAKLNQLIIDPKNKNVPLRILAEEAGKFSNDAFGGQDWARIANEIAEPMFRRMAQETFKPAARPYLQLALFAPDWTISNMRIAARAFPAFNKNEQTRNLYQWYLINGAILYGTIAQGMNYAFSGHSTLENKDPTRIDLGNGEVLTFSKQFMEPFHWITDPQKTGLKKMGSLTKTFAEVATNKKYLSTGWSPQITKKDDNALERALAIGGQVGKKFLPIWVNQAVEGYMKNGLSYDDALNVLLGQLGHPKYQGPRSTAFETRGLVQDPMKALF